MCVGYTVERDPEVYWVRVMKCYRVSHVERGTGEVFVYVPERIPTHGIKIINTERISCSYCDMVKIIQG